MGRQAPLESGPSEIPQPVDDLAEIMLALRSILALQDQVRGENVPFFVRNVGGLNRSTRLPVDKMMIGGVRGLHNGAEARAVDQVAAG